MTNNDYLILNKSGAFLDGRATLTYRGEKLSEYEISKLYNSFRDVNMNLSEDQRFTRLDIMSSKTSGIFSLPGNPSSVAGPHIWARAKLADKTMSEWMYCCELKNASDAAKACISVVFTGINLGMIFEKSKTR